MFYAFVYVIYKSNEIASQINSSSVFGPAATKEELKEFVKENVQVNNDNDYFVAIEYKKLDENNVLTST
jgi:hypothetical protein